MFRASRFILLLIFAAGSFAADDPSPPTPDDAITEIACSTAVKAIRAGNGNMTVAAGDYHYRVYLPPDYSKDADETFPCMFIFSPEGNAKPGHLADFARKNRWVLVMLVESKNGTFDPVIGNFLAAYDDAVKRIRIQPGMLFATGESGGARAASMAVELRPGFGGVLLQGAGFWYPAGYKTTHSFKNVNPSLAVYALFGQTDMNRGEAMTVRHDLPPNTPYRWDIFTGGHQWAPTDAVEPALQWLQKQSLLHGTMSASMRAYCIRQVLADATAADSTTATPWEKYESLDAARQIVTARALDHDAKLKTALHDLDKRIAALAADPAVKKELDAGARFDAVAAADDAVRSQGTLTEDHMKLAAATAAADFQKVADDFPDTTAGREAKRFAVDRGNETK
jgi:hypothetical protein